MLKSLTILAAISIATGAQATTWEIDPVHSNVLFKVKHMMISDVTGNFGKFGGKIVVDDKDITKSTIEATIETASIDTGIGQRDEHLKSPDFLDAKKYPTITFKSKKVTKAGKGKYKVAGDFTMRGVTKEVTLEVDAPGLEMKNLDGTTRTGAAATTTINRKDFGASWNKALEAGGILVSEEVAITLHIQAVKKDGGTAAK